MQTITRAELLNNHPSVQDLNVITGQTTNNPVKQARMAAFRESNTQFIGDEPKGFFGKKLANLCNSSGGQRIVVQRNEENIRKGRAPPSVVGASMSTGRSQQQQQQQQQQLPPMLATNNNSKFCPAKAAGEQQLGSTVGSRTSGNLPPRSPASNSSKQQLSGSLRPGEPLAAAQLKALSMPQLLKQAAKRRRPGATPSDISLVTSVESRDASTNHPCSETVYTCSCCRPHKPASTTGSAAAAKDPKRGTVWRIDNTSSDSDLDDLDMYENLTSVSQRGSGRGGKSVQQQQTKPEVQISAQQIFELQQARAGGGGSLGHNMIGTSGRGPKAMGFGLTGQKLMQDGVMIDAMERAAAGKLPVTKLPPGMARSDVTGLTATSVTGTGSRAAARSSSGISRASSSAVRRLEVALEQERQDRQQTEEQISRIRERQEKLMAQLTPDERSKMRQLLNSQE